MLLVQPQPQTISDCLELISKQKAQGGGAGGRRGRRRRRRRIQLTYNTNMSCAILARYSLRTCATAARSSTICSVCLVIVILQPPAFLLHLHAVGTQPLRVHGRIQASQRPGRACCTIVCDLSTDSTDARCTLRIQFLRTHRTHLAPANARGEIIDCPCTQEGVSVVAALACGLCSGITNAVYATTTEVYPDSETNPMTAQQCVTVQVTAVTAGLAWIVANAGSAGT